MPSTSKLEIYNGALARIGTKLLLEADVDENLKPEAVACNAIFPGLYRGILSIGKWKWAIKRGTLGAREADDPLGEDYSSQYMLPDDAIRMVGTLPRIDWEEEGNMLLCDATGAVVVRYIYEAPTAMIDGPAQRLLETGMAIPLATRFQRDEQMAQRMAVEYGQALRTALETIEPFIDLPTRTLDTALLLPGDQQRRR